MDIETREPSYLFGYSVHSKTKDLEIHLDLPPGQGVVSSDVLKDLYN
jgi:hypothetical protein